MGFGTVMLQPTVGPPVGSYSHPPPQPVLATTEPTAQQPAPAYDNYFDDSHYPRRVPLVRVYCIFKFRKYFQDRFLECLIETLLSR